MRASCARSSLVNSGESPSSHTHSRCRDIAAIALAVSLALVGLAAQAEEVSKSEMRSLDGQVQEIKSDVLSIAAELSRLEERLLYPSNTQVAVFVSLAAREGFELDSVQIEIDGELAARHIYSFKELEALRKGGVQRIYTGNVATGEHHLKVTANGKLGGSDYAESRSFEFRKGAEPKLVEIELAGQGAGDAGIRLGSL
jgi:hypothetical protein